MALKNLSVEEMVAVSSAWVSAENPARHAIGKEQRLASLLPDLTRVHAAIYAVAPRADNPRKAELSRLLSETDAVHDVLAGGIYGLLTEMSRLDDEGADLISLRDALMPQGLAKTVQSTYRGQAGHAGLLRERLTAELRQQLAQIPLRKGNLLERTEAWLATADRLGALEEERARLELSEGPSFGTQTVEARNAWIRVVNAFVSLAVLAELDEATDRIVFGPLRDGERKADMRAARRRGSATGNGASEAEGVVERGAELELS